MSKKLSNKLVHARTYLHHRDHKGGAIKSSICVTDDFFALLKLHIFSFIVDILLLDPLLLEALRHHGPFVDVVKIIVSLESSQMGY
jgi:hypothetical protein